MFKTIRTAAIIAVTATAPALADEAKPHQFGATIAQALTFLTVENDAIPFTRDAQLGEGAFDDRATLRKHANVQRTQVFPNSEQAATRSLPGYIGFAANTGRIDR